MSSLHQLSDSLGIYADYHDLSGSLRVTSDETRVAIIQAMGMDASSETRAAEALRALASWERDRVIEPVFVVGADDPEAHALNVYHLSGPWRLDIQRDDGFGQPEGNETSRLEGVTNEAPGAERIVFGKLRLHPGYYTLTLESGHTRVSQRRVVTPPRCVTPDDVIGEGKAFGLTTNLYSVRSARNWGVGDLTDLAELAEWAGSIDAAFVGMNPLHALLNRGHDVSPYSPTSRIFRNPIYIDVEALARRYPDEAVSAALAAPELREELEALREERYVRYDQVMAVKGIVLDAIHKVFARTVRDGASARARVYADYVTAHDPALTRFATYLTIGEGWGSPGHTRPQFNWHEWEPSLRDSRSSAVARIQREHAERVDYHTWVQFELDHQMEEGARRATAAGLAIGLYQDLAIGSAPDGADTWAHPELFAAGVSIGAPPDPYAAAGQNWGLPPLDPRALREDGYRYFIQLVRSAFRHSGALRIDHVMGLFRLFWIPKGMSGSQGAYVRYPSNDLLGILALESHRQRAIVVGEDLGTVPDHVRPALRRWGILSSKVLFFERNGDAFRAPHEYPRDALATANTHDMVPLAGFETARDIVLREEAGALPPTERQSALDWRQHEIGLLAERLRETATLVTPRDRYAGAALRAAVHEFISRTPSVLSAIALDDLSAETDPVNIPGVTAERYPCWTRKMRLTLGELMRSDEVRGVLVVPSRESRSATS